VDNFVPKAVDNGDKFVDNASCRRFFQPSLSTAPAVFAKNSFLSTSFSKYPLTFVSCFVHFLTIKVQNCKKTFEKSPYIGYNESISYEE